jgi:hypothetical protein
MKDLFIKIYQYGFDEGQEVGFEKGFKEATDIKLN